MKVIKPNYFDNFKCIANKCKDSCCSAGWQIQVDNKSLSKYNSINDNFFNDINNYVNTVNKTHCFKNDNGNCIFLKDGLCSLVTKYGDSFLCDVCRDYPRFYNYVADVVFQGLSFDCEAVCNLVLGNLNQVTFSTVKSKDSYVNEQTDTMFKIIHLLQDRQHSIVERINNVLNYFNCNNFSITDNMFTVFDQMEWLNFDGNKLKQYLQTQDKNFKFSFSDEIIENLLVYFVYRHFINKTKTHNSVSKIKFVIFCTWCCDKMQGLFDVNSENYYQFKEVTTFCRQVEYSAKNISLLLNMFK